MKTYINVVRKNSNHVSDHHIKFSLRWKKIYAPCVSISPLSLTIDTTFKKKDFN